MTLAVPSEPPLHALSVSALAARCTSEISKYRCGEPYNDQYCVELFRRAMVQHDPLAWEIVQQRFQETMLRWMRAHPQKELACRLDSEENYVALAFARILDTLRDYLRPNAVPLPEPGEPGEPFAEDSHEGCEVWEVIQNLLPGEREQRVAYLLFHCSLKPREIVRFCPEEFSEVKEIYRLRRNIMERLLRHTDYLRWQL